MCSRVGPHLVFLATGGYPDGLSGMPCRIIQYFLAGYPDGLSWYAGYTAQLYCGENCSYHLGLC